MDDKELFTDEGIEEPINDHDKHEDKDKKQDAFKEIKEWAKAIITAVIIALIIRTFLFEIIQVDGYSMFPTLEHQDRVLITKINYYFAEPKRGDIIIFRNPDNQSVNYVKRAIGLGGQTVKVEDGIVYIDGEALGEEYIHEKPIQNYEERLIPPGTIFAMGDNRNHSRDSRDPSIGFVPLDNILGKAKLRLWPLRNITLFK